MTSNSFRVAAAALIVLGAAGAVLSSARAQEVVPSSEMIAVQTQEVTRDAGLALAIEIAEPREVTVRIAALGQMDGTRVVVADRRETRPMVVASAD